MANIFGNNAPRFFYSDEEDVSEEGELSMFDRIDAWLKNQDIHEADPSQMVDEIFDDIRRKTFSEFSRQDAISLNETSPFFLASPLASSIILERNKSSNHEQSTEEPRTPQDKPNKFFSSETKDSDISSTRKLTENSSCGFVFPAPSNESEAQIISKNYSLQPISKASDVLDF